MWTYKICYKHDFFAISSWFIEWISLNIRNKPDSSAIALTGLGRIRSDDFVAEALGLSIKGLGSGLFLDYNEETQNVL
jgi:hypothetical protein